MQKGRLSRSISWFLRIVFVVGLGLMPLVFWPWADVAYELPRVWWVQRWIELTSLLGIAFVISGRRLKEIRGSILVLFFVLVATLASLFGVDLVKSGIGNYYRGDGLVTLYHLVGLYLVVGLFWDRSWRKMTAYAVGLGSVAVSVWAVIEGLMRGVFGFEGTQQWGGAIGVSFGQPNFLAGYLVVTLPVLGLLHWRARRVGEKVLWGGAFIANLVAIGLTRSWGGVVAVLILGLLWRMFLLRNRLWRGLLILSVGIVLVVSLVLGLKPNGYVFEGRRRIVVKLAKAYLQRPILGWGWANVDYAFESVEWPIRFEEDIYLDKAHSTILEVLVTSGGVGLILYLVIVSWIGVRLVGKWRSSTTFKEKAWAMTWLLVFGGFMFHSQTNVISIGEEVVFWLVMGIASVDG